MKKAERLLAELTEQDEVKELMRESGTIETVSDFAEAILSTAQRLGIETDVDAHELVGYLQSLEVSQRAATEQAVDTVRELDDEDLENVVGGQTDCGSSASELFSHAFECWKNDKCATYWWN